MNHTKPYAKIVPTPDGGSAFEDAHIDLAEQGIASGVPPMLVGALVPAATAVYLQSAAFDSQPHPAPREQWVVMLRGTIEVEVSSGEKRRFGPGDLVFVADTSGQGHVTTAIGEPPFEALFLAQPAH